jgi:ubiquitin-protein ligase E3 A
MFLHFEVHRKGIFEDSVEILNKLTGNLKNPLKITFIG